MLFWNFILYLDKPVINDSDWSYEFINEGVNGTNGSNVFVGMSESFVLSVLHLNTISFCSVKGPQSKKKLEVTNIKPFQRTERSR